MAEYTLPKRQRPALVHHINGFNVNHFQILRQVFGIQGGFSKKLYDAVRRENETEYDEADVIDFTDSHPTSVLGTPMLDTIRFSPDTADEFFLDDAPIIDVDLVKDVELTKVHGRGSVKEHIGIGDYEIRVRGVIVNHDSYDPPYDRLREFKYLITKNEALPVACEMLNLFGINEIVIMRPRFFTVPGFTNAQFFQFQALSDEPAELIIK